jgi:hypothetical protein
MFDVGGTRYAYEMDCRDADTVDWLTRKSEWKALNLAKRRAVRVRKGSEVMDAKGMIDRVASGFVARRRKAGGSVFHINKSPLNNYRKYVEGHFAKWLEQTDWQGTWLGELEWDNPKVDSSMNEVADYFKFKLDPTEGGQLVIGDGKVTARFQGSTVYIAVMIYD